jgi:hypothetical protein
VEVAQDLLKLIEALARLVAEKALADFVPAILRNLALDTALFHLAEPCVHGWVLLRFAEKTRRVLPRVEDGFEVKFFGFECVEHGNKCKVMVSGRHSRRENCCGILLVFVTSSALLCTSGECLTAEVWDSNTTWRFLVLDRGLSPRRETLGSGRVLSGGKRGLWRWSLYACSCHPLSAKTDQSPLALPFDADLTCKTLIPAGGGPRTLAGPQHYRARKFCLR